MFQRRPSIRRTDQNGMKTAKKERLALFIRIIS